MKTLTSCICALLLLLLAELDGWGQSSNWSFVVTNGSITIVYPGYNGSPYPTNIPSSITYVSGYDVNTNPIYATLPVTSIGDGAFFRKGFGSLTIPDSVTSIGYQAFYGSGFQSVTLGNGVTSIGSQAFYDSSLQTVSFGNNISFVGDFAFAYCALQNVTIPSSFPNNGFATFLSDYYLTNLTLLPNTTVIGSNEFEHCWGLTSISIPNTVTNIGTSAFEDCRNLKSIVISDSVTSISDDLFYGCSSLTNVTLGAGIRSLASYEMFYQCYSLSNIIIPSGVTNIGNACFFGSSLQSIYFLGNAPVDSGSYLGFTAATIYYLPGTSGWGTYYSGRPTRPWLPTVQTRDGSFGIKTNSFGFNINWANGQTIVVDACTNLGSPNWQPVQTNSLTTGSVYFSDSQWTNSRSRFYRVRSQ